LRSTEKAGASRLPMLQLTTANHSDRCLEFYHCSRAVINHNVIKWAPLDEYLRPLSLRLAWSIKYSIRLNHRPTELDRWSQWWR